MALALMRRHRRWLYIFLWLVIAAFIILYIPAFQSQGQGTPGEAVVSVGGLPISVGEFQRSFTRQRQRIDQMYQGRLTPAMLRQMGLEDQVLESLVAERLVELEAKRLGITVSDEAIARAVATSPAYQNEGRFIGTEELRRRLELQGLSEDDFALSLRRQLLGESLQGLVGSGVSVSDAEVERELLRRTEQAKLEYVLADSQRFKAQIAPADAEIKARFEAKPDAYKVPEKRVASYVLLDREALRPQVSVSDRDLELYYQDNQDEFSREEQACASHILVKVKQGDAAEGHAEEEARALAQGLLDQLKAGGDFAALATKSSEDQGSASRGGDLGCFAPGRMVAAFDEAVFALKPGQTSELVKSPFGYHIIRLASRTDGGVRPLAEVKEPIRAAVLDRKMSQLGELKSTGLADALKHGKTLEQAAKEQGLAVQKSAPIARGETPAVLSSPTLVARLFTLKPGELEKEGFSLPQGAVFVALAEVQPAHAAKLEEVREKVRADLVEEQALARARELALQVRAAAEKGGLEKAATAAGLVRKETPALTGRGQPLGDLGTGQALDAAAFALPQGVLSEPVRTPAGWALLRVLEKKTATAAELASQREPVRGQLREQRRSELFRAFLVAARERYPVERDAKAWNRALGRDQQQQQ